MIKQNYLLTEEEKKLILKQHLEATKNHYIMEQSDVFGVCFKQFKVGGIIDVFVDNNDYKIIEVTWKPDKKRKYSFYKDKSYNSFKISNDKKYTYQYTDNWYCDGGQLYIKSDDKYYKVGPNFSWTPSTDFQPTIDSNEQQPLPTTTTTTVSPPSSPQTSPVSTSIFQKDNDGSFGYGSINRWVGKLQDVLNKLGKTDDQGNELKVDRKFGKKTISALKTLEDYEDFESGDEITVGEIRDIINNYKKSQGQTTQSTGPTPTRVGTQSDSTTGQSTPTPDTSTTGLEVTFDEL